MGSGPKYTIRQKFDIDGTWKEKRHKNAHKTTPFPGPGTYEFKECLFAPRYTMGKKYKKKQMDSTPGVGHYNLRFDNSLIIPIAKFPNEEKSLLSISKDAINFPGPEKYDSQEHGMESKAPKYTFSKSKRWDSDKRAETPGPGAYSFQTYIGNDGPRWSFYKEIYKKHQTNNNPAPGDYLKDISYNTSTPNYSMPRSLRKPLSKESKISPGPWKYDPHFMAQSQKCMFPSWRIGNSKREDGALKRTTPGPGNYETIGGFPGGYKITMGQQFKKSKQDNYPGPGKYDTVVCHRQNEPKYTIGNEKREDNMKAALKNNFPGPGKYSYKDEPLTKKITFTKDKKGKLKRSITPGPGAYKIPCSFDDINNLIRTGASFNPAFKYV